MRIKKSLVWYGMAVVVFDQFAFYATDWFGGKDTTRIADEGGGAVRRAQENEGQS